MIRQSIVALLVGAAVMHAGTRAWAQPTPPAWTGEIRCDIEADAPGYTHRETQTWVLTGGTPTTQGSNIVHPATWSVKGKGVHDRARSASRRLATWTVDVPGEKASISAPIAFARHAVGGKFDVMKWHSQLTSGSGYNGTDQNIQGGMAQPANRLSATVYEWQFPKIEADLSQTELEGSNVTTPKRVMVGPLQPDDAAVTVTCSWSLRASAANTTTPTIPGARATIVDAPPDARVDPREGATRIKPDRATLPSAPQSTPPAATSAAASSASSQTPIAPPATPTHAPPATTPPTSTGTAASNAIEIYPYFVNDGTVPSVTWWPPNGTARYVIGVDNTPPHGNGGADGTVLTVPAVPGLIKTGVACVAVGGAQCPVGLTIAQIENGVAIPRLPAFGVVRIAIEGTVTGALGSSITVKASVKAPLGTRDTTAGDDTVTKTHAILTPSTDSTPQSPVAVASGGRAPVVRSGPAIAACTLTGPTIATPTVSPTGAILSWGHINGAHYTVSRDDVGIVTTSPLTAPLYPATVTFTHSAPVYSTRTYRYSVTAEYGGGCGISTVDVTAPPPAQVWAQATQRRESTIVDIVWQRVFGGGTPPALDGGVRVFGPRMPTEGFVQSPYDCEQNINGIHVCTLSLVLAPGTYTWNVVPYWETQGGVLMDVDHGTRVTVTVQ